MEKEHDNNERSLSLRVDADILAKFRYVSDHYGRSANSQLIQLMLRTIATYEKEYKEIPEEDWQAYKTSKKG